MTSSKDVEAKIAQIQPKTMAARLRPLWPSIEDKIAQGIEHQAILDALNGAGFDLKLSSFRRYLQRYREQEGSVKNRSNSAQVKASPVDGNPQLTETVVSESPTNDQAPGLDDILDSRKRDSLTDQYANATRPLFKKK